MPHPPLLRSVLPLARGLASARTAPAALAAVSDAALRAPTFADAWPHVRDALLAPRSKVEAEVRDVLASLLRRHAPGEFLPVVLADANGAAPLRLAAVDALEAAAGRADATALLAALDPFLGDGADRVRERAATTLAVLALHAPDVAGARIAALAAGADARRAECAAVALWGLASRDLATALAALEGVAASGRDALARRALVQVGFAYRWRPFDAAERAALWASLARVAALPKGPGRRAVVEVAQPLRAFNASPDALADLDRFLASHGAAPAGPTAARPAPRPLAACGACGAAADFAAYFCPACGDVKAHNPLRLAEGLPVARSPAWPKSR